MLDEVDKQVLNYLSKQDWPVTTEMVAKELKISWNTAQIHLYKLMATGMVIGRKMGKQNQWVITEKGKKETL